MLSTLLKLVVSTAKDLIKHKSFLVLILLIMVADHFLKTVLPRLSELIITMGIVKSANGGAEYLFDVFPGHLLDVITNWRTPTLLLIGFLLKELLSLWPSSDMRRMHRNERGKYGVIEALLALRWRQMLWDAAAVFTICVVAAAWCAFAFIIGWLGWRLSGGPLWAAVTALGAAAFFPLGMAGFSYSSKLAVISNDDWKGKFLLFSQLFTNRRITLCSWGFYAMRTTVEGTAIFGVLFLTHLLPGNAAIRIAIAALVACPVYSYLKMLSFKFFLEMYKDADLVRCEYAEYFTSMKISSGEES